MLLAELAVGTRFTFTEPLMPPAGPLPDGAPTSETMINFFFDQPVTYLGITDTADGKDISIAIDNPLRRFQWLRWYSGRISKTPLELDILSGPMSGCWITLFRSLGVTYVTHIGTTLDADENANVKSAWRLYASANGGDLINGFRPWFGLLLPPPEVGENPNPKMFALLERAADGTYSHHTLITYAPNAGGNQLRVAAIEEGALTIGHALVNIYNLPPIPPLVDIHPAADTSKSAWKTLKSKIQSLWK